MKGTRLPESSDFPVIWDDDEEPTRLWTWDEFHSPLPASTMSTSMGQVTRMGMGQASKESKGLFLCLWITLSLVNH